MFLTVIFVSYIIVFLTIVFSTPVHALKPLRKPSDARRNWSGVGVTREENPTTTVATSAYN